jgi:hypothetical protein
LYHPAAILGSHDGGFVAAAGSLQLQAHHPALLAVQQLPWERQWPAHEYKYHMTPSLCETEPSNS